MTSNKIQVPMGGEQVVNNPEETASSADTGYETSSVVSTSSSSQMPNKVRKAELYIDRELIE